MYKSARFAVDEPSGIGEVRRAATALAERMGFDTNGAGRVALVATEAATNLQRHARGGEIIMRPLDQGGTGGVEILAVDRGPGIADVGRAMQDGFSTIGTKGEGLGAMRRVADSFDIHSLADRGTVVAVRIWSRPVAARGPGDWLDAAGVCLPQPGEEACGDDWSLSPRGEAAWLCVVDGLGHGTMAASAAAEAMRVFRDRPGADPEEIVRAAHEELRGTRGAAMAVAVLDHQRRTVRFAGLGNITAVIVSGEQSTSIVSYNGIVGHELRRLQTMVHPFPEGAVLVMHTDGIASQWRLGSYPGLVTRAPAIIGAVLYRDFGRQRDDSTVLVAREA